MPSYIDLAFDVPEDGSLPEWVEARIRANVRQRAGSRASLTLAGEKRTIKANRFYRGFVLRPAFGAMQRAGLDFGTEDNCHDYMKHAELPGVMELLGHGAEGVPAPFPWVEEVVWPGGVVKARYTTRFLDSTAFALFVSAVMRNEHVLAAGTVFEFDADPGEIVNHPELARSRSYDLEMGDEPWYDAPELPPYPPEAVDGYEPEPAGDGPSPVERATSQALAMGLDDISSLFSNHG